MEKPTTGQMDVHGPHARTFAMALSHCYTLAGIPHSLTRGTLARHVYHACQITWWPEKSGFKPASEHWLWWAYGKRAATLSAPDGPFTAANVEITDHDTILKEV